MELLMIREWQQREEEEEEVVQGHDSQAHCPPPIQIYLHSISSHSFAKWQLWVVFKAYKYIHTHTFCSLQTLTCLTKKAFSLAS